MKKLFTIVLLTFSLSHAQINVVSGTNTPASYTTLKTAFDSINSGYHTGALVLEVVGNTTETSSAALNASGSGLANYSSINIYPTTSGLNISGNIAGAIVDFNGADNVTLDGRVNATGTAKDLVIDNSNTGGWTIRFINDATSNIIQYCVVRGSNNTGNISSTQPSAGVILFSTTTATSPVGNDNNTISNCDIDCRATAKAGVVSVGTSGATNSGLTISNCNIFDFYINNASTAGTAGIVFGSQTATSTSTGNSFYQTASREYVGGTSVNHYVILVNNPNGPYIISNNFIGGSSPNCGGSAWTTTQTNTTAGGYRLWAIDLEPAHSGTSEIQGNTIRNFNINSNFSSAGSGGVYAIVVQGGSANIGNTTGNIIGSTSVANSIIVNCNAATGGGGLVAGITVTSTGVYNISNNIIGGILTSATTPAVYWTLYGIHSSGAHNGLTISNNTIGSTTQVNSINNSSGSGLTGTTQYNLHCIRVASGVSIASAIISNNTIANITMSSTSTARPQLVGIISTGTNIAIITGNIIRDFTYAGQNNTTSSTSALLGMLISSSGTGQSISQNQIFNLTSTHASAVIYATGLFYQGGTGTNTIERNRIYNIALSTSATTHTSPAIAGIFVNGGTTSYFNNLISIGRRADGTSITTGYPMSAVYAPLGTDNFYFNTIHMCGTDVVSAGNTYAFDSRQIVNTRNFRNNIFVNSRSNTSGTGKNYAVRVGGSTPNPTGLTINYNNYVSSGTGAVFGFFNNADVADLTAWQTAVGQDVNSKSVAVTFVSDVDLHLSGTSTGDLNLIGTPLGAPYNIDIDNDTRDANFPYMGADEGETPLPVELTSFSAVTIGSKVKLSWQTATEINNYGFEIERASSSTSSIWEKIGFVEGNGNSNSTRNYSFEDNNLTQGKYSYRLKQIDNDGTFEFSSVIEVDLGIPTEFSLSQNYPNPFNPMTKIHYTLPVDAQVTLQIYSITGELVESLVSEYQTSGSYTVDFDGSNYASGTYIYRLVANDFVQARKMSLIK